MNKYVEVHKLYISEHFYIKKRYGQKYVAKVYDTNMCTSLLCLHIEPGKTKFIHSLLYSLSDNKIHLDFDFCTSQPRFSLKFAIILNSSLLGKLSPKFKNMALGIYPFNHKSITEIRH